MTFQQAFLEINGYDPTPEQVKHAIAVARIVKEADLDPILLVYLADAQAQAARERGAAEIRQTTKEAVERLRTALPSRADAERSIGALAGVQTALEYTAQVAQHVLGFGALIGVCVGVLGVCSTIYLCSTAFAMGRANQGEATHRRVCDDLNSHIAAMSAYWRKLGLPAAAEKLGQSYDDSCRR